MRTWVRARFTERCGSCGRAIQAGAPMLELHFGIVTRPRCEPCAESIFGESAPDVIAEDALVPPQPSLPMERHRGPDFVTPRQLARSVHYNDYKRRQAGGE